MNYELILLNVADAVATLTLNRPDKRNAMSDDMRTEFIDALERVAADKAIKALVLTGAGKGFCAGGDIAGMQRRSEEHTSELQSQSKLVCRLLLEKKKKQSEHDESGSRNTEYHAANDRRDCQLRLASREPQ